MNIIVNGKPEAVSSHISVAELLAQLHYRIEGVAVAVNTEFIPRSRHAERALNEDDRVEIVGPIAGG